MQLTRTRSVDFRRLANDIKCWGRALGFQQVGIAGVELGAAEARLLNWLAAGRQGEMHYMAAHGTRRSRPPALLPGTTRVISARMDYYPESAADAQTVLSRSELGYVARYALGRDYHKLMRKRLEKLAQQITQAVGSHRYRVFSDSAPVLEKALAEQSGLGWIGKHTNLLHQTGGSWFFLGEIYTDAPLPVDEPARNHCGRCEACIEACPTGAIVAPYELDARLCISYLTIELHGAIPVALRPLIGNRIFGCDDCQLACPWNRFAQASVEPDFAPRHRLDATQLVELFSWSEGEFLERTRGSTIRRLGYARWLRNIAVALGNAPTSDAVIVALGNAPTSDAVIVALKGRRHDPSPLVREHVRWALQQHEQVTRDSRIQTAKR
jgi:epoxyqueuosine reductase